jgi:hypothetical protein
MDLRSLTSLSENRLSWSAEVPLKKPGEGKQGGSVSTAEGYHDYTPGLTSVCHRLQKDRRVLTKSQDVDGTEPRPWESWYAAIHLTMT